MLFCVPGVDMSHGDMDSPTGETNLDSLNDSDSAVILEDGPGSDHEHCGYPRFRSAEIPPRNSYQLILKNKEKLTGNN